MADKNDKKEEIPSEDNIRVICRFRPLNDTEERTGSKFVVKFPSGGDENVVNVAVSHLFAQKRARYDQMNLC